MSALPTITPKLAKIIPMLSSPNDGEVVNTARAIERTLKSAGLDWHDFAKALTALAMAPSSAAPEPSPKPPRQDWESPRYTTAPPRWKSLRSGERIMAFDVMFSLDTLSAWEKEFARSIYPRLRARPETRFTDKQVSVLDGLLVKIWEQGIKEWEEREWG